MSWIFPILYFVTVLGMSALVGATTGTLSGQQNPNLRRAGRRLLYAWCSFVVVGNLLVYLTWTVTL